MDYASFFIISLKIGFGPQNLGVGRWVDRSIDGVDFWQYIYVDFMANFIFMLHHNLLSFS